MRLVFALCVLGICVSAQDKQLLEIEKRLKSFDAGVTSLSELTEDGGSSLRKEIIRYYDTTTNKVSVKSKLVISRSMGIEGDLKRAVKLAEEYTGVYSNDYRGWRVLGSANVMQQLYEPALKAYTKAVELGDDACYSPLCYAAIKLKRLDVFRSYLPELIRLKKSDEVPKHVKLDIVGLLVAYAGITQDKKIFLQALDGMKTEDILSRKDFSQDLEHACSELRSPEVEAFCRELEKARLRMDTKEKK